MMVYVLTLVWLMIPVPPMPSVMQRNIEPTVAVLLDYRVMVMLNASFWGVELTQNALVIELVLTHSVLIVAYLIIPVLLMQSVLIGTTKLSVAVLLAPLGIPTNSVCLSLNLIVCLMLTAPASMPALMRSASTHVKY